MKAHMPETQRLPSALAAVLALLGCTLLALNLAAPAASAASGTDASLPAFTARVLDKGACPTDDGQRSTWLVEATTGRRARLTLIIARNTQWPTGGCAEMGTGETVLVADSVVATDAPLPGTATSIEARVVRRYPTPTPPPVSRVDVRGILAHVSAAEDGSPLWTFDTSVSGLLKVVIASGNAGTRITPAGITPSVGMLARVVAESRGGGSYIAQQIDFIQDEVSFTGLIQAFPDKNGPNYQGPWKVANTDFVVDGKSVVQGIPKLYRRATVRAVQQGQGVLKAVLVTIDDSESVAETFSLQGKLTALTGGAGGAVACVPFSLGENVSVDSALLGQIVQVDGYRSLGVGGVFTATRVARLTGPAPNTEIAITSYVDSRTESNNGPRLFLGSVAVDVPLSVENVAVATRGTVVEVRGQCAAPTSPTLTASALVIVARPYVRFKGTITDVAPGLLTSQPQLLTVQLQDSADTLQIRPPTPWQPRYEPQIGLCVDGYGFVLADGTIGAKSLTVDRCSAPPAPTATPRPAAEGAAVIGAAAETP